MVTQPYFMSNKNWYSIDEDENYILTTSAPKEAVEDYDKRKSEYIAKVKKMTQEQYLDFIESEDSWLSYPLD